MEVLLWFSLGLFGTSTMDKECNGIMLLIPEGFYIAWQPFGQGFQAYGVQTAQRRGRCYTLELEFMVTQIGCDIKYVGLPLLPNRRINCRAMPHMKLWLCTTTPIHHSIPY